MKIPILPDTASTFAEKLNLLMFTLVALTLVFTAIVGIMMFLLGVRYRRGNKVDRSRPVHTHEILEISWTLPPLLLGLVMFVWGAKLFAEVRQPPDNALEIFVIGKRWMWHMQHPNGVRENNELHVPLGRAVKLTMISQDVIHDMQIPAFRIHQDVVPGRYTSTWFEPTETGRFHLFCAQYCGTNHSEMVGWVTVMQPAEYENWLASGGDKLTPQTRTMEEAGGELYEQLACANCHGSVDTLRGPSLLSLYGKQRKLTTGQVVTADNEYLRESLVNPYAKVVAGYTNTMPEYKDQLTEEKILELIAYMKTLGTAVNKTAPTAKTNGATKMPEPTMFGEPGTTPAKGNAATPANGSTTSAAEPLPAGAPGAANSAPAGGTGTTQPPAGTTDTTPPTGQNAPSPSQGNALPPHRTKGIRK